MPETKKPAIGSHTGIPKAEAPIPTKATTEESASLRWCHALATTTELRCSRPILTVARNSHSFTPIEIAAAAKAWVRTVAYLQQRIQAAHAECPGRAPDLSEAAAAAMRAALAEVGGIAQSALSA